MNIPPNGHRPPATRYPVIASDEMRFVISVPPFDYVVGEELDLRVVYEGNDHLRVLGVTKTADGPVEPDARSIPWPNSASTG